MMGNFNVGARAVDKGLRTFLEVITQPFLGFDGIVPTHPAERPFDALVVVPADAVVDRSAALRFHCA